MASNSRRKLTMKCCDKKRSLVNTHIFCVKVIDIVSGQFAYVCFSIGIPFKGSQSHSNMRSKVTAVSYLSMTPLCMSQRCQWLRCATNFVDTPQIRSSIQKGPCIRDLGGVIWWKKQRSKIFCQGLFNLIDIRMMGSPVLYWSKNPFIALFT
jgi:hypothetical protein